MPVTPKPMRRSLGRLQAPSCAAGWLCEYLPLSWSEGWWQRGVPPFPWDLSVQCSPVPSTPEPTHLKGMGERDADAVAAFGPLHLTK